MTVHFLCLPRQVIKKGSSLGSQIAMETKGATDAGKGLLGITISVHSFGSGKVHVTLRHGWKQCEHERSIS